MARGEMLRNVAQGEVETWTRTIRVDEKREHVETFFFTNTNYIKKTLGQLYCKNDGKWKLNLTASNPFLSTTPVSLSGVRYGGGKAGGHTEQDIRGGSAIAREEREKRGGKRHSAPQHAAELTVLPASLMPHQNRLCLIFLSMCPTGEGHYFSISLSLKETG